MTSSFVRTVLGDIAPDQLGVCYAHEHLIIDKSFTTYATPDFLIDDVDSCVAELKEVYAAGGRSMIDSMPMSCGRNVLKLAEVSRRSGMHIVCPTGLHLAKYYLPGHWSTRSTAEQLAQLFIREITNGICAHDASGPDYLASSHRAGLIKIASSLNALTDHEQNLFRAAAIAHRATGCPILTHTEEGTAALQQVELLSSLGVDPSHVVLSHTDRKPDLDYHRQILRTGVRVEYDSAFRWKRERGNPTRDLIATLLPDFPDQIMIGMDAARRSYWKSYGGVPGLTFLLDRFVPQLIESGVSRDLIHRMLVTTPARAYQFKEILQ
jgi:5-phospho-D-xylono-1,4-lactonase